MRDRRFRRQLGLVAIGALAIRIAYVVLVADGIELGLDSVIYELLSGQIADHGRYVSPGALFNQGVVEPTAAYPPLYPTFLALVDRVFGASEFTFQMAGAAVGSITVVIVGLLGRRVGGNAVGVTAASIVAVYPLLLASDASVMTETVYVPIVLGCVLAVYRIGDDPTLWRWVGLGVLLGAAALTRVDGLLLAPLLIGVATFRCRHEGRRSLLLAAVALVVMVGAISPWLLRNDRRIGEPTLATVSSAATLAGANCPATFYGPRIGFWEFDCIQSERQDELGELEWSRTVRRAGVSYAFDHPSRLLVVAGVRVARMWGLYHPLSQARAETVESRTFRWQVLGWAVYLTVALLAAAGAVVMLRARMWSAPLAGVIVAVSVTAMVAYGNQRFRLIADPVLAVGAAVALVAAFRSTRSRSGRAGGLKAPAAAPGAIRLPRGATPARGARPS